jgi:hypothetical protein
MTSQEAFISMNRTHLFSLLLSLVFCASSFAQTTKTLNYDFNKYIKEEQNKTYVSESTYRYIPGQDKKLVEKVEADIKFKQTKNEIITNTDGTYTVKEKIDAALAIVFASANSMITDGERYGSALAIEYVFANNLLDKTYETAVSKKILGYLILTEDATADVKSGWAGILVGMLSNYYPPEGYVASYTASADYYPAWRGTTYRKSLLTIMENAITCADCPVETRIGIARGWGYVKPEADAVAKIKSMLTTLSSRVAYEETRKDDVINQTISDVLEVSSEIDAEINPVNKAWSAATGLDTRYRPGVAFDSDSNNGLVASVLFQALGYIYKTQGNYAAKEILLNYMRYSGINDKYPSMDSVSFTLGIYAALAAGYYGITEANDYLESIALWHATKSFGMGAIPLSISQAAYDIIPEYVRTISVDKKFPEGYLITAASASASVGGTATKKETKVLQTGTGENILSGTYNVLKNTRDGLIAFVLFDFAAGAIVGALYGSEAAAASSFIAADVGYMIAGRYGTMASYEFTLMVEQRAISAAFRQTLAGKLTENVIVKPLTTIANKFGGLIKNVKSLVFKNTVRFSATAIEDVTTLGAGVSKFGGSNPFPTADLEFVVPSNSSGALKSNTIYVNTAAKTVIPENTYIVTAKDFANYAKNVTPINTQAVTSTVEAIAPKQVSAYMNTLKQASTVNSGLSTVTVTAGDVLTTISPALITNTAGVAVNGFRITNTIKAADDVVNMNTLYFQENGAIQQLVNLEFSDGITVQLFEDEAAAMTEKMNQYELFCGKLAA